ncbi:MAG: FAD-dependent oxidoreductase [Phycisphaerales bacterium]
MPPDTAEYAVLGSGVVGLTTAVELAARGAAVTLYADRVVHPRASEAAPALFTPYPGPDLARFQRWTERSLSRFKRIAGEDGPESGVDLGILRQYFYKPAPVFPWLDTLLNVRPIRPVPAPCLDATTGDCPHIDMHRYLPWLESRARAGGVTFVDRGVAAIDDLFAVGHRVVLNCAGYGARALAADPLVRAMHGQVLHVPNDIGLDYSIHDDAPVREGSREGLVAYIFVFRDRLVLGGTFEGGREKGTTDRPTLDAIVERCRGLLRLDGHPRWRDLARHEIGAFAGVRPARGGPAQFEATRVERVERAGRRVIVHNYGHGRSGVTFSWASAEAAADLALGA